MDNTDKHRAGRNKTVTISDIELSMFGERLVTLSDGRCVQVEDIIDRTLHGDMTELLPRLPATFADLIFIDPPYNLTRNFNGMKFRSSSEEEYIAYLRFWFPKVVACLKPNGSLYICGDWRSTSALQTVMRENLTVINRITWQREKGRGALRNWKNAMEDIWFGVNNEKEYYFNTDAVKQKRRVIAPYRKDGAPKDWITSDNGKYRLTYPSNLWDDISIPYWSMPENTDHPTQKPEKLLAKLILASCPPDGIVFDPFLGSGTTSVVAKKLGRHYIGIETSELYCCLAEKRLAQADSDKTIQGYTDGVFWERNTANLQRYNTKKR